MGPVPPKIHINCGAALMDRQHLSLNKSKMAALLSYSGQVACMQRRKLEISPQATPVTACLAFDGQQRLGAAFVANPGADTGHSLLEQFLLERLPVAISECKSEKAPVTIVIGSHGFEAQRFSFSERAQRRFTFINRFNTGKPQLSPVVESERAAIAYCGDMDGRH